MIGKIGCRAHDYGQATIEQLGIQISDDSYQTIQLALKKALIEKDELSEMLNNDFALYLSKHLKNSALEVSVLGAYRNYAHPDDAERAASIDLLKGHLEIAQTLDCRMVGTETGSLDPAYKAHPDNHGQLAYERFREAIESVMSIAQENDTYMAVEAVAHHIIHTPERMKRLVDDINHKRLKVIFDINNIITPDNHEEQDELINQMFDTMEEQIWAVHVKDYCIIDGQKVIVPVGEGELNLDLLMKRVKESSQVVDVLAENIPKELLKRTFWTLEKYLEN